MSGFVSFFSKDKVRFTRDCTNSFSILQFVVQIIVLYCIIDFPFSDFPPQEKELSRRNSPV